MIESPKRTGRRAARRKIGIGAVRLEAILGKRLTRRISGLAASLRFLSWALVFGVIYAQSPLYTSNQNQYFLHGLAQAGIGYLAEDWLANTRDPTPLFSLLVSLTVRIFRTEALFYAWYALLLGVYLYSVIGILNFAIVEQRQGWRFICAAIVLAIHSAGARFFLSRALGPAWTFVLEGGLANQRLLGAVFQPSVFGVFLVLAIYAFLLRRTLLAALALGAAVSVHPTYLLPATLLTLGLTVEALWVRKDWRQALAFGFAALVFSLPAAWYAYSNFASSPAAQSAAAREILVHFRIPHHARVSEWFDATSVVQLGVIIAVLALIRKTRLFPILLVCLLAGAALSALQVLTQSDALALLFPWRISVILAPLSTCILAISLARTLVRRAGNGEERAMRGLRLSGAALILLAALVGVTRFTLDLQRKSSAAERPMMAFVAATRAAGQVYLIPTKMQDFRLATGVPAYVEFKSIPYRDGEVLEWRRRIELANRFYAGGSRNCSLWRRFSAEEGVSHVVLEGSSPAPRCEGLSLIYQDASYRVYALEPGSIPADESRAMAAGVWGYNLGEQGE